MSFTWFAAKPLRTREQVAREVHAVSLALGLDELATVIALMTISTEVGTGTGDDRQWWCPVNDRVPATKNYPNDSKSDDNRSSGYFQQQPGPNGEPWWGTAEQMMTLRLAADSFLSRLPDDYTRAASNPALAGQIVQQVQQSSFPDRYAEKWDEAWMVLRRALGDQTPTTPEVPVPVSGDPVWLEDVLRPALGDRLKTLDGWKTDGVGGTMGNIWGVIWHHTGNAAETPQSISQGRPDLQGPLAQIHIAPDGIVTIVAVGPCNHAGAGSWPGLPTDGANAYTIGIECAWPRNTALTEETANQERWPDAQIISMRDVGAALTKHLGVPVSHNISHREWARFGPAGQRQYKWDPGNLDMDWFRGEIQKDIDGAFDGPATTPVPPSQQPGPVRVGPADDQLQFRWNCLGGQTLIEAVAQIRDKVCGTNDRGKAGVVLQ
jgi:hypothetical protein